MNDVTDLTEYRNRRAAPDPEYVLHDEFGRQMFRFLLRYTMDDGDWSVEIWAYSMEDAGQRVAAIRRTLTLDGQLMSSVPA